MKRIFVLAIAIIVAGVAYSQPLQLLLGAQGGIGGMYTFDQLPGLPTNEGNLNVTQGTGGISSNFKGEALLGIGRFRIGYQFLYAFSAPNINATSYTPNILPGQYTTYFNASRTNYFGNYLLLELAVINTPRFALTPGLALGSYSGYKVDNTTDQPVYLGDVTRDHFSIGADLNAEIKFSRRWTFLFGPNYYLFGMQDRFNNDWREYSHFFGIDAGFRVNILPVHEENYGWRYRNY